MTGIGEELNGEVVGLFIQVEGRSHPAESTVARQYLYKYAHTVG